MRRFINVHIILLFAVTCPVFVSAQSGYLFNVKRLTVKNGLIHQEVNTIFQDSRGFIWLGTRFGLSRYDGYEFKNFTREKDKLSDNSIDFIYEDGNRQLWLFYTLQRRRKDQTTAIDIMQMEDGTVTAISSRFPRLPFDIKTIRNYFISPKKELFIYAGNILWKYQPPGTFTAVQLPNGFVPLNCQGNNGFWGTLLQQYVRLEANGTIQPLGPVNMQEIPGFTGDNNQYFYTSLRETPYFRWLTGAPVTLLAPPDIPPSKDLPGLVHYNEKSKLMWVSRGRELLAYSANGTLVYRMANTRDEPVERMITNLFADRSGVTWVATQAGVILVELKPELFTRYLYSTPGTTSGTQPFYQCRGIFAGNGYAIINTYRGNFRVNLETGQTDSIYELTDNGNKLPNRFPVYKDPGGHFYSGANVVIELDPENKKELRYLPGEKKRIWSLFRDAHGDLLIGTADGLYIAGKGTDTVRRFTQFNQFGSLADGAIIQILTDRKGTTWLVSSVGLFIYDKTKGITAGYSTQGKDQFNLPANNIQHLYIDSNNIYWLATEGAGLIRWNTVTGDKKVFSRADGLSSNNIYSVYEDRDGYLWMSSDYGIMRMHKTTEQVITYTTDDGLSHYEFNRVSHFQAEDGRLFFGGLNGVTAFYPEKLNEISAASGLAVTIAGLQQYVGKSGNMEDYTGLLLRNGKIVLRPSDKFFILKLASPEFIHSDKTVFFYKIEGLDKEWTRTASNNIRIGRLPYGRYTLVIKAQSGNGSITPETRIPIQVIRPFYLRWWFFVLAGLLIAFSVRFYYLWYIRQLRKRKTELELTVAARTQELQRDKATIQKQAEELKQLDEMKSSFFANVSHELRTPLTLLAGPVERLMQQSGKDSKDYPYLQLMQQNVQQLQNRVNEILDLSKIDGGKLELKEKPVQPDKLIQPLIAAFESLAQQKNISFMYRNRLTENNYLLLDGEQIKKIINNLLSNAFKFTPSGGQVLVTLTDHIGQIIFKVSDTGEGIHPDEQEYVFQRFYQAKSGSASMKGGTGIGLALTSELVSLMKGRITLESEPGKGSTFYVELPKRIAPAPPGEAAEQQPEKETTAPEPVIPVNLQQVKGATLLLAEDNPGLQQYIQLELKEFRLVIAGNGAEALHILETAETLPQLVISDVMMPIMDGFTLLEKIKADERFRRIPVIMLTARADIQDKLHALRIGVDDYLVKPFITEELVARVVNLLERYQARNNRQWEEDEETGEPKTIEETGTATQPLSSAWLMHLEEEINGYLDRQEQFTLDALAEKISLSKRQLQRNIKEETGLTANNYIKELRLHRARFYLESKTFTTLNEVSFAVGFNDPHYFSSIFTERYGKKPVSYLS